MKEGRVVKEKNKYFRMGLMIFAVFAAVILFFFFIFRYDAVKSWISNLLHILSPIIIGIVIAYLLNPLVEIISGFFKNILGRMGVKHTTSKKVSKGLGIASAMIIFIAFITALVWMVIPSLMDSVNSIINNIEGYGQTIKGFIDDFAEDKPAVKDFVDENLDVDKLISTVEDYYNNSIAPQMQQYMRQFLSGVMATLKTIVNILVGLCVAVYLLTGKDKFIGESKKVIYAVFKREKANVILAVTRQVDNIFGGFITGKLVDSLIIGLLCFIGTSIVNIEFAGLISVIIGITNIIPFFGPWIGAIPTSILVLATSPSKTLIFVIFVIALQQFDGNILGPTILGDATGLSAFWVVVAITVGGGFFGVLGMILGVPVCAVIYFLVKTGVEFKLKKNKMPIESTAYTRIKRIDPEDISRQEMLQVGMTRRDRRKNKIDEYEVNREIAVAARMSEDRKAKAKAEKEALKKEQEAKAKQPEESVEEPGEDQALKSVIDEFTQEAILEMNLNNLAEGNTENEETDIQDN